MKKIIFTAIIVSGLLTSFVGCENVAVQIPPSAPVQFEQVSMRAEHGYTALRYGGFDVNPQHFPTDYDTDDIEFVNEIWNTMNYVEWTEYDGESTANIAIELTFADETGGAWYFSIDPSDIGWVTNAGVPYTRSEKIYYTAPKGVYENLSVLLTEYSAENFKTNITVDTIKDFIQGYDDITFASGEINFNVQTAATGNFTDEWRLDEWVEIKLEDGPLPSNKILIYSGAISPCIDIFTDELFATVSYQGHSKAFSFGEEVADIIWQQFVEFHSASNQ